MSPPEHPVRRALRLFGRALRLRCAHCGGGPVFLSWSHRSPNCPSCGIRFERGERGYWLGAYFFNLILMETVFTVWFLGFLAATWPAPPWKVFHYGTIALMLVAPVVGFPFSKTLFFAFDLLVRPPVPEDFEAPREATRRRLPRTG
ncbi:MAG TPA: DUF983 domain-containing protein [Gemmatimonadales bacterium]|nr:DUF983 domain-containing protein [Gemmatimonadales bacterium]